MSAKILLGIYKHYKGDFYNVIAIGRNAKTTQQMVVYHSMGEPKYNSGVWIRCLKEFDGLVECKDGEVKRFEFVKDNYFSNPPGFK
jgi:hypothetical protein